MNASCPADFDFLSADVQCDPMAYFAVLRAQAPVYREPQTGAYLSTGSLAGRTSSSAR
jgi:hypothetical protein